MYTHGGGSVVCCLDYQSVKVRRLTAIVIIDVARARARTHTYTRTHTATVTLADQIKHLCVVVTRATSERTALLLKQPVKIVASGL